MNITVKLYFSDGDVDKLERARAFALDRLVRAYGISGYTDYPATGVWQGETEHAFVIEIVYPVPSASNDTREADEIEADLLVKAETVAAELAQEFGQYGVLVVTQVTSGSYVLVGPKGRRSVD